MLLYHGSNTANIKVLKPNKADHDRPYVYMTTIDVVAAFYLCNAVERPYYWFPISHFEDKSERQLEWWYSSCVEYLKEKNMIETPDCSYAVFIKEKLPHVWERYIALPHILYKASAKNVVE